MDGTAAVVGSGPNGLAAAAVLARAGLSVTVYEAADEPGGATRSAEILGPGIITDLGSAVHPFGVASPVFAELGLERHGLEWLHPETPMAHPLPGRPAAMLERSLGETADGLGRDGRAWHALHAGVIDAWPGVVGTVMGPVLRPPPHPISAVRFGLRAPWPASALVRAAFREEPARALLVGSAAHSWLPMNRPLTSAFGVLFGAAAHATGWPVARGGSGAIAAALVADLEAHGGTVRTGARITDLAQVRPADLVLLDLTPRQVLAVAGAELPPRYARALQRWRYGPGAYKVDYLLDGPVPWSDPLVARAGTVHVGGTAAEISAAEADVAAGRPTERPFVLVAQQSRVDPGRVPAGQQVLWAYAHVAPGATMRAGELVDRQIERFAPGFRDRVLGRVEHSPADLERWDANLVGGDVGGGAMDGLQAVLRPVARPVPYATPLPGVYLCSASTPPGGGVHGMCGYHAARAGLRHLGRARC